MLQSKMARLFHARAISPPQSCSKFIQLGNFNCTRTFFLGYLIRWLMANEVWTAAKKEINGHPFYELRSLLILSFSRAAAFLGWLKKSKNEKRRNGNFVFEKSWRIGVDSRLCSNANKEDFFGIQNPEVSHYTTPGKSLNQVLNLVSKFKARFRLELRLSSLTRQEKRRSKIWRLFCPGIWSRLLTGASKVGKISWRGEEILFLLHEL